MPIKFPQIPESPKVYVIESYSSMIYSLQLLMIVKMRMINNRFLKSVTFLLL